MQESLDFLKRPTVCGVHWSGPESFASHTHASPSALYRPFCGSAAVSPSEPPVCPTDTTSSVFAAFDIDDALVTATPEHVNARSAKDPVNTRLISLLLESPWTIGIGASTRPSYSNLSRTGTAGLPKRGGRTLQRFWLPDASTEKLVNLLDVTHPAASQAHPGVSESDYKIAASALYGVVTLMFASWNQTVPVLQRIDGFRRLA